MKCKVFLVHVSLLMHARLLHGISVEEELTLTQQEKNALDKFKLIVENDPSVPEAYMKEDIYLIRWLRIGKLDLARTENKFKEHLRWRHDNKIGTILEEDFSAVGETFPMFLDGEDKTGRPIIAASASAWDVRRGVISGSRDAAVRYIYYAIEYQARKIREKQKLGQNVTQIQVILDLSGYNIVQHGCLNCIPIYLEFVRTYVYRYPYLADSVIFVNVPPVFEIVVQTLNLRNARTTQIKIFGPRKSEWQKYLLSIVNRDQLPKFLGGTLDDDT